MANQTGANAQKSKEDPIVNPKKNPIKLRSDYWDEDGIRRKSGSVILVDNETARKLTNSATNPRAIRADPLPGEKK